MDAVADWFRALNDARGINLTILYDAFDANRFLVGLRTTLLLSGVCILGSLVLGVAGAALLGARSAVLRGGVRAYVGAFRNTPPLVQLAFFYFALSPSLPTVANASGREVPLLDGLGWAMVSFSLFAGAFNVEIFRSGIEAVPAATVEAAESLGYSRLGTYRRVVLPLGLRVCLPALGNNLVNLVKTTTLAYAVGVPELVYAASQIWSEQFNVREMMNVLLVTYVLIVAALVWVLGRWERALRIPGHSL